MNKRKLTYPLIAAVIFIWGMIIYKFFGNTSEGNNSVNSINVSNQEQIKVIKKDTFELMANYEDPFLKKKKRSHPKQVNHSNTSSKTFKKTITSKKKVDEKIKWPKVKYKGMIENQSGAGKLAILDVNGQELLLEEKMIKEDIVLDEIFIDSVLLSYKGLSKVYRK